MSRLDCIMKNTKKKFTIGQSNLILLHSERPKLHTILAFLSAIGLNHTLVNCTWIKTIHMLTIQAQLLKAPSA